MIDRILHNGNIITLNDSQPRAQALAITGGRVVAVGYDDDILPLATAHTIRENLNGQTLVPGMTDAHIHWLWTARTLREVDIFEAPSREIIAQRVAERAATLPAGTWIVGQGWTQEAWDDKSFPTAADLDAVTPDHPVYLRAKSAHAFWANSLALRIAGIDATTPDPEGGSIGRDADGNPNGMLYEMAGKLITRHIPSPTLDEIAEQMLEAQKLAHASGLTGIHDYDGPDSLRAVQLLRERGQLGLRVLKNINYEYIHHAHEVGLRWGFGDEWIRIGGLKIFADGALGPRTAWMIDPYEGEPGNFGVCVVPPDEMREAVVRATLAGLPATIHAIGDRAVREVLNVYEHARRVEAEHGILPDQRRHRIEHVQIIHPDDVPRMAQLRVVASMQPLHATSDYLMSDRYWGARSQWAYNPRIQLDQGVVVAFGSDSPVDPFEPLRGIHAAVTRQRTDGSPEGGWYPQARLTTKEALTGFTLGASYAAGTERFIGRIAPGYLADCVLLDQDLLRVEPEAILDVNVLGTMVHGEWRFGGV